MNIEGVSASPPGGPPGGGGGGSVGAIEGGALAEDLALQHLVDRRARGRVGGGGGLLDICLIKTAALNWGQGF